MADGGELRYPACRGRDAPIAARPSDRARYSPVCTKLDEHWVLPRLPLGTRLTLHHLINLHDRVPPRVVRGHDASQAGQRAGHRVHGLAQELAHR